MRPPEKIRLDPSLYQVPGSVYFFTIVSNFKKPYFVDENLNNEIIDCFKTERERMKCKIYVYCVMPDHLHLLCGANNLGVSVLDLVLQRHIYPIPLLTSPLKGEGLEKRP